MRRVGPCRLVVGTNSIPGRITAAVVQSGAFTGGGITSRPNTPLAIALRGTGLTDLQAAGAAHLYRSARRAEATLAAITGPCRQRGAT